MGGSRPAPTPSPKSSNQGNFGFTIFAPKKAAAAAKAAADKAAAEKAAAAKATIDPIKLAAGATGAAAMTAALLPGASLVPIGAMHGPSLPDPVAQGMTNTTPKMSGAYAPIAATAPSGVKAPIESAGGMPATTAPAVMNKPIAAAAATQTNQTSSGANQFAIPSINNIRLGGS